MFTQTALTKIYRFAHNNSNVDVETPNPKWSDDQVLDHLSLIYPSLATATPEKPFIEKDKIVVKFTTTVGTKG